MACTSYASAQVQVGPQIRIDVGSGTAAANETSIASFDSDDDGLDRGDDQFLGDYLGLARGGSRVYPCYLSTQNGDPDIYTRVVEVEGTCCLTDGSCTITTETSCAAAEGTFSPEYTQCEGDCDGNGMDDACELMACCLIDRRGVGSCIETREDECIELGGEFNCGWTCSQIYCAGTTGPQRP